MNAPLTTDEHTKGPQAKGDQMRVMTSYVDGFTLRFPDGTIVDWELTNEEAEAIYEAIGPRSYDDDTV